MSSVVKLKEITDYLNQYLGVSNRQICSFINITPSALSSQIKSEFREIAKNKVGRRVAQLYLVVHTFEEQGISKEAVLELLRIPCFKDLQDNLDSVLSSIQQGKYDSPTLIEIGKLGYQEYQRRKSGGDKLFPVIKELMAEI